MTRRYATVIVGILCCTFATFDVTTRAQTLADADIEAVIKGGKKPKVNYGLLLGIGFSGPEWFTARVEGPRGRIQRQAQKAAAEYKPFTKTDVTEDMMGSWMSITATPRAPFFVLGKWTVIPPATGVVLQPKGSTALETAAQPTSVEPFPVEWANGFNAKFQGQGVVALFNLKDIPEGDFDVIVVPSNTRLPVKAKDRTKLQ